MDRAVAEGQGEGAVDRPRDRHLGVAAPLEEGLRRAAAQTPRRRACLHPVGQIAGARRRAERGRLRLRAVRRAHDETKAVEDTTYLFISNGPVLFFDENGFTRYTNWEVMEKLRAGAAAPQAQAAE
jgi:hypothetical protein